MIQKNQFSGIANRALSAGQKLARAARIEILARAVLDRRRCAVNVIEVTELGARRCHIAPKMNAVESFGIPPENGILQLARGGIALPKPSSTGSHCGCENACFGVDASPGLRQDAT
jgi:hypothetical protein